MAPLYPTLLFLALVSQFKPSMSPFNCLSAVSHFKYIHLPLHADLAKNHAQLQRRQTVNETCARFCTPEFLALVRLLP